MKIEFHYDFGSPNAYLVHKVIPATTANTGIEFEYVLKQELIAQTESSVNRGTFGSPTFYVEDDIFFGKDKLR